MPGPQADPARPYSRHRPKSSSQGLVVLPNQCEFPVPPLPGGRAWSDDEKSLWESLWRGPQANEWDDSFIPSVAAYVCHFTAVLSGDASAWAAQEMRHLGEQLGLTPRGMRALGWTIAQAGGGS